MGPGMPACANVGSCRSSRWRPAHSARVEPAATALSLWCILDCAIELSLQPPESGAEANGKQPALRTPGQKQRLLEFCSRESTSVPHIQPMTSSSWRRYLSVSARKHGVRSQDAVSYTDLYLPQAGGTVRLPSGRDAMCHERRCWGQACQQSLLTPGQQKRALGSQGPDSLQNLLLLGCGLV